MPPRDAVIETAEEILGQRRAVLDAAVLIST
jgi:hypothetical protein